MLWMSGALRSEIPEEGHDPNLLTDLKEERDTAVKAGFVSLPMTTLLGEWEASLKKYPPIKMGTPDPYVPPKE